MARLQPCSSHSRLPRTAKRVHGTQRIQNENESAGEGLRREPALHAVAVKLDVMARSHVKLANGIKSLSCAAIQIIDHCKGKG